MGRGCESGDGAICDEGGGAHSDGAVGGRPMEGFLGEWSFEVGLEG